MNRKQKLLVGVLVLFMITLVGSSCVQDLIVPAYIDENAIAYSGEEPTMFTPYTSLWDLQRIERSVDHVHFRTQKEIVRMAEDDSGHYGYLKEAMLIGVMSAQELKSAIFSPSGPLGALLIGLPTFGLGAMLISKPEDKKKITALQNGASTLS